MKRLYTALITPFKTDGSIDEAFLLKLLEHQRQGGVKAILALGSTAESYALSLDEKYRLLDLIADFTKRHNISLCVNVSANVTDQSVAFAKRAKAAGADSLLMLPPFYVSLTSQAQFEHFEELASHTDLPIILYNHPGRTGVHLSLDQVKKLSQIPTIIGIKDASADINYVQQIIEQIPSLLVYSGDDSLTLPLMSMGATGVISVMSNLLPGQITAFVEALALQDLQQARLLNQMLRPLFSAMSLAPNPALIKAMLACTMGMSSCVRRPLKEVDSSVTTILKALLTKSEIIYDKQRA